ncbi:MAG: hypothetical protein Q3966_00290 [Neisseria sp.]|nr:hypothetical protein [Neisseria sp.]
MPRIYTAALCCALSLPAAALAQRPVRPVFNCTKAYDQAGRDWLFSQRGTFYGAFDRRHGGRITEVRQSCLPNGLAVITLDARSTGKEKPNRFSSQRFLDVPARKVLGGTDLIEPAKQPLLQHTVKQSLTDAHARSAQPFYQTPADKAKFAAWLDKKLPAILAENLYLEIWADGKAETVLVYCASERHDNAALPAPLCIRLPAAEYLKRQYLF